MLEYIAMTSTAPFEYVSVGSKVFAISFLTYIIAPPPFLPNLFFLLRFRSARKGV